MSKADLYQLLQVDPAADPAVIRAAYRVLAAKHHPDVGGDAEQMAELNGAWSVLSDAVARSAYDRDRRVRVMGDRWDAYAGTYSSTTATATATAPASASQRPPSSGTILEFGRYAGWSIPEVARADPDYLEWLVRTPNGRRYGSEINDLLHPSAVATAPAPRSRPASRGRWGRR
jgi:curved DNA-binding protein CbpA